MIEGIEEIGEIGEIEVIEVIEVIEIEGIEVIEIEGKEIEQDNVIIVENPAILHANVLNHILKEIGMKDLEIEIWIEEIEIEIGIEIEITREANIGDNIGGDKIMKNEEEMDMVVVEEAFIEEEMLNTVRHIVDLDPGKTNRGDKRSHLEELLANPLSIEKSICLTKIESSSRN